MTNFKPKSLCYFTQNTFKITKTPFKIHMLSIALTIFSRFTVTPFIASHANTSQTHWYTILYPLSKMKISPLLSWQLSHSLHHQQLQSKVSIRLFLHKQQSLAEVILPCNRMLLSFSCAIPSPSAHVLDCQITFASALHNF
jgi:hypothetical protein